MGEVNLPTRYQTNTIKTNTIKTDTNKYKEVQTNTNKYKKETKLNRVVLEGGGTDAISSVSNIQIQIV